MEFVECDTCRAKPGSPYLCGGCLRNRETISTLNEPEEEEDEMGRSGYFWFGKIVAISVSNFIGGAAFALGFYIMWRILT